LHWGEQEESKNWEGGLKSGNVKPKEVYIGEERGLADVFVSLMI